ncbi:hypothetical protein M9458_027867, partial [Cirrhinus mrigala]
SYWLSGSVNQLLLQSDFSIIYNWTLNGKILKQGPMVRNTTIQLNETSAIGNISCSVKNHVSYGEKTISVEPCP